MPSCDVCGGEDFSLADGYYHCNECQTQSQDVRETLAEEFETPRVTVRASRIVTSEQTIRQRRRLSERRAQVTKRSRISSLEGHNIYLQSWTDTLLKLGFPSGLRESVLTLWSRYLHHKRSSNLNNSQRSICLVCLALLEWQSDFVVSDLVRWAREGILPVYSASNELPEDVSASRIQKLTSMGMSPALMNINLMQTVRLMELEGVSCCAPLAVMRRLVSELALPSQLALVAYNLSRSCDGGGVQFTDTIPEVWCAALLLAALKLLLGLDDLTEVENSTVARARNEAVAGGSRWFVFTDWLRYSRLRVAAVASHHVPTMSVYAVLDPCRPQHRREVFGFYQREGVFRDRVENEPLHKGESRFTAENIRSVFNGMDAPTLEERLPVQPEHLWRPLSSRLEQLEPDLPPAQRAALADCGQLRAADVTFLMDNAPVEEAIAGGLVISVVPRAARRRAVVLKGPRKWDIRDCTVTLLDDADVETPAGDADVETNRVTDAGYRDDKPLPSALTLYRPSSDVWFITHGSELLENVNRIEFEKMSGYWPDNFLYILTIFAHTVELIPRQFAHFYNAVEKKVFCCDIDGETDDEDGSC